MIAIQLEQTLNLRWCCEWVCDGDIGIKPALCCIDIYCGTFVHFNVEIPMHIIPI